MDHEPGYTLCLWHLGLCTRGSYWMFSLGQQRGEDQTHLVQYNRDKVSDNDANRDGANHVTEHLGVFGVNEYAVLVPLRMIEVICV